MNDIPWAAVIAAISALSGVLLTSILASRRAKDDRLWDLRRAAYGDIICRIREITRALRSDPIADRKPKVEAAKEKLAGAYQDHLLLISSEFEAILLDALKAMAMNEFLETGQQAQAALADALGDAGRRMTARAKEELSLDALPILHRLKRQVG